MAAFGANNHGRVVGAFAETATQEVYEYQRLRNGQWSSALLPTARLRIT